MLCILHSTLDIKFCLVYLIRTPVLTAPFCDVNPWDSLRRYGESFPSGLDKPVLPHLTEMFQVNYSQRDNSHTCRVYLEHLRHDQSRFRAAFNVRAFWVKNCFRLIVNQGSQVLASFLLFFSVTLVDSNMPPKSRAIEAFNVCAKRIDRDYSSTVRPEWHHHLKSLSSRFHHFRKIWRRR